jgi:ribonucleotide reductase alpha subunit
MTDVVDKAGLACESVLPFKIESSVVNAYKERTPPFGFNGLGELVYRRTYARELQNGEQGSEQWYQTVERVVNGTYNMQKRWILSNDLDWDDERAQNSAKNMYGLIFDMKFLPPGRGLWAMGSPITEERQLYAALNNCAFVSTRVPEESSGEEKPDPALPYMFLMDASMLGVGVGFDTHAAGKVDVYAPRGSETNVFPVPDSREGWVESVKMLLDSYFKPNEEEVHFDYSLLRPAGSPIRGFGGYSSGSQTLKELHKRIRGTLDPLGSKTLTITAIVDLMNHIGKCVVSGNVRRTAEIAFGEPDSEEYVDLKNYEVNPQRAEYGWTSNNSVFAKLGMSYDSVCERVAVNGEPGFAWLENMRAYGRMVDPPNYADYRVMGGNPCLEQSLESYEMCCLVETFPARHKDLDEYLHTLKYAYLYAKSVTLGETHWDQTNEVMSRNRRIGCSMSGIAQLIARDGLDALREWSEAGYETVQGTDDRLSSWFNVPPSVKTTSIKPSGTVSLLAGATPGIHFPESRFYIRRVRMGADSNLLAPLESAGYHIEPAVDSPETMVVVEIPVDAGENVRTVSEVSMWEQLSLAAFMQRYWADNQVSCTVTFDPETEQKDLARALDVFQYQLKGVSFLPKLPMGAYEQMPYEEISESDYKERMKGLAPVDFTESALNSRDDTELNANNGANGPDAFCDGDKCTI